MYAVREAHESNPSKDRRPEYNFYEPRTPEFLRPSQDVQSEDRPPSGGLTPRTCHQGQVLPMGHRLGYSRRCSRDRKSLPESNAVSLRLFNLTSCCGSASGKLFLYGISGHEVAGLCRVKPDLHFAPEPVVVSIGFLLPKHDLPHVVAQYLCSSAVERLDHRNKVAFQVRVNSKSEGCLSHVFVCYKGST